MSHTFGEHTTAEEAARTFALEIKGKNVLVTGASPGGLGAETARVIAKYGANLVVLAGRTVKTLQDTSDAIKKETPGANIRLLHIDLFSLESVRKAASEVNAYEEPIQILINNAAIMACPYATTAEGIESQFGTNHLGHFLFTALLFPRIQAASSPSSPSRIILVSSRGHQRSDIRWDDLNFGNGSTYDKWQAYGQSKTANILFANEVARRSSAKGANVLAYSLHPGAIGDTNLARETPLEEFIEKGFRDASGKWLIPMKNVGEGTSTTIVAAFDPAIKDKSGAYLTDAQIDEPSRAAYAGVEESGVRLWSLSEKLVDQTFSI